MNPRFLSLDEALAIHRDMIARYGGVPGIRDMGLLESALGMPQATYDGRFLHTDIYEMAAAYLFHMVKDHPFVDGNKRAGAATALIFLYLNGHDFFAPEETLADMVIALAENRMNKAKTSLFIRRWSRQMP
jgi:death-on-curing protein